MENVKQKVANKQSRISNLITVFMCGDVMTGRGIDQVLPHPSNPLIYEPYMKSAKGYIELAEMANGPIPQSVDFSYVWGDALEEFERLAPDLRMINLGYSGLIETLETLKKVNVKSAGAGLNLKEAETPAVMEVRGKGRVIVFSFGSVTSGIPLSWAATEDKPGVNLLKDMSDKTVRHIKEKVQEVKQQGDIVVISIHWGGNWGYEIPREQTEFAHMLIEDASVDVIHGHSSHHVKGIEVYRDKPIIYGCGDFLDDYEGISGYEDFRDDLGLMYFASMEPLTRNLVYLRMTPTQIKHFKVNRASRGDALWLRDTLNREGKKFGTRAELNEDNTLTLQWN